MSWDDLEPGQDDLVRDGGIRGIRRKKKTRAPKENRRIPGGSPVKASIPERVSSFWRELGRVWKDSYRDAQTKQYRRQQARRARKGK